MTKTKSSNISNIWGSRFSEKTADLMQEINQSISFDHILYKQDIQASLAHAKMLYKIKILNSKEHNLIKKGLKQIAEEIKDNKFNFKIELEDIHMNIESRLKEIIGPCAGKLHTARSRNDQIATDLKLFVRDEIDQVKKLLLQLNKNIIKQAKKNIKVIMPGFTHLQIAQPVLFSHHLMAYLEMFKRDISRLNDCQKRLNECPLGSAALAGTSFKIDRKFCAKELNFDRPTANSMDSVSDRDFIIEYLSCLSLIASHLSRMSEELIIWSSKAFNFIKIPESFTSGSSIMPQKRNPDAAELVRGKTGRIYGSLISLLTVIKGLNLTYSKDMQEDKEPLFDATKNIKICIDASSQMIAKITVNKENMYKMASQDFSTATDIADWLVQNLNIAFRECHHITGKIVKLAEDKDLAIDQLPLIELQKIEPRINEDIYKILSVENSIDSRNSYGGTSSKMVKEQIELNDKYK
jgi:argininosuccinate lyase